ncbi:type IV secretion system protein [Candidatus Mycosynbacter amalyticus]|uniref:type IV secretion system protein n=1 Tax=Candidatus Mycosynbacter amalyticus TaxID=2665156 RepID=UPI0021B27ED3|nr:type IV secretion system protein [Candidatus Mycosynbacter amalyticus]
MKRVDIKTSRKTFTHLIVSAFLGLFTTVFISTLTAGPAHALDCGEASGNYVTGYNGYKWDGCPGNANWDGDHLNYGGETFNKSGTPNGAVKGLGWEHYYDNDVTAGCSDYIAFNGSPETATKATVIPTHFGNGYGGGCALYNSAKKEITLNNGKGKNNQGSPSGTGANNEDITKENLEENVDEICKSVDPDNAQACRDKISNAFDECAKTPANKESEDKMLTCIAGKTGYPKDKLSGLFNPPDDAQVACKIQDGIGWIICPASSFLAKLTDGVFNFLEGFLRYDSLANQQSQDSLKTQWSNMRNLANVAFIGAFLVVIYSQITGAGLNTYSIKRLLPRIIIAAILVNISFWVCIVAVDLSNIIGANLKELIVSTGQTGAGAQTPSTFETVMAGVLGGTVVVAGIAASGALLGTLSFLLPVMLSALFAALTVILILVARQAIITILVVISPLAFVAYLLPNTSKWFDRWKDTFISMLLLYPFVALVFGGAQFAAGVVLLGDTGVLTQIFSLGLMAIPLFIIPAILKSTGGMLGKIGAISNDKTKGLLDRANNKGQQMLKRRQMRNAAGLYADKVNPPTGAWGKAKHIGRRVGSGSFVRDLNSKEKDARAEQALKYSQGEFNRDRLMSGANTGNARLDAVLQGQAVAGAHKAEDDVLKGLSYVMAEKTAEDLAKILDDKNTSAEEQAAALAQLIKIGDVADKTNQDGTTTPGYGKYINKTQEEAKGHANVITRATAGALSGSAYLGAANKAAISNGQMINPEQNVSSFNDMVSQQLAGGRLSANGLAGAGADEIAHIKDLAKNNQAIQQQVTGAAKNLQGSQAYTGVGKSKGSIDNFAKGNF